MPRCFVGLPLPSSCQEVMRELIRSLERGPALSASGVRVSWTRQGNGHLTLQFLGEVSEVKAMEVRAALAGVSFSRFTLQVAGGGFFPDARQPRVVWSGVEQGADDCAGLAHAVQPALQPLGFAPERRPFHAHLTLGRVRQQGRVDWLGVQEQIAAWQWPEITLDRFVLFQSVLGPQGPTYERLAEYF